MPMNSPSEQFWNLLHEAQAVIQNEGFVEPFVPFSSMQSGNSDRAVLPIDDLASRYLDHLALGSTWPQGQGSVAPQALVISEHLLSENELEVVRTWFENPRVNLRLLDHFWIQALPPFAGTQAPFREFFQDLCSSLRPKAIFSLGAAPATRLLGAPVSLQTLRSADYRFGSISLVTTLEPREFLQIEESSKNAWKAQVWKDIQRLLGKLRYG